jgi:hypothetical protein
MSKQIKTSERIDENERKRNCSKRGSGKLYHKDIDKIWGNYDPSSNNI